MESNELSCSMPVQADMPQSHEPLQTVANSPKDTLLASGDQALSKIAQHTKTAEGEEREHQDLEQDCGHKSDSKSKTEAGLERQSSPERHSLAAHAKEILARERFEENSARIGEQTGTTEETAREHGRRTGPSQFAG